MATGFVQRFKGKIQADQLWTKGWAASETQSNPAAGSTLGAFGSVTLASATAAVVFTMQPPKAGIEHVIAMTAVSSGVFLKAPPGVNFGVFGGSTIIVLKSTSQMTIEFIGISTVQWAIQSVWTTSTSVIANPTFSTTT